MLEQVLRLIKLPFKGELRDYQVEDILTAYETECFGGYLDTGLGKTVISSIIGCCKVVGGKADKIYVLCPASLITQWHKTVTVMGLDVLAYVGNPKERKKMHFNNYDVVIMSYEIYRVDYDKIIKEHAGARTYYIVDECTNLCNQANKFYKLTRGGEVGGKKSKGPTAKVVDGKIVLTKAEAPVVYERQLEQGILLTATPINRPTDAYGLIAITNPDAYLSEGMFDRLHVEAKNQYGVGTRFCNLELLQDNLFTNAVLRRKEDHLELPPIIYNTICYELSPKHMVLYNKLLDEKFLELPDGGVVNALNASALRHWAQRIITNPDKGGLDEEPMVFQLMDTILPNQDKFLIFASYVDSNLAIMKRYSIGGLFGKISKKKKEDFKESFINGDLRGLAIHPKSGGYGLDLPMAHYVNHLEIPITPRDFRQTNARAHRSGQLMTVYVTLTYAKSTIQEAMMKRLFEVDKVSGEVLSDPRNLEGDLMSNPNSDVPITKEELLAEMKGISLTP